MTKAASLIGTQEGMTLHVNRSHIESGEEHLSLRDAFCGGLLELLLLLLLLPEVPALPVLPELLELLALP